MKKEILIDILYIIVSCVCIFEYIFIKGMFTGIASMIAIGVFSIIETITSFYNKSISKGIISILLGISLISAYITLL